MFTRSSVFSLLKHVGAVRALRELRCRQREVAILDFHRVTEAEYSLWPALRPKVFAQLLEMLARNAVVKSLADLRSMDKYPDRPVVVLTFDDGYVDFYDHALPILSWFGFPVVHSICPGLIDTDSLPWTQWANLYMQQHPGTVLQLPDGRMFRIPTQPSELDFLRLLSALYTISADSRAEVISVLQQRVVRDKGHRLMTWQEIRRCAGAGVEFASHSMSHQHLPTVDNDVQLQFELMDSRRRIADEVGYVPSTFAFPSGFYDRRTLQMARAAGYQHVLVCDETVIRLDSNRTDEVMIWPRVTIGYRSAEEELLRALGFHQGLRQVITLKRSKSF